MPYFDGTGPRGFGPMTGRGMGPCGRGFGRRSYYMTKSEEKGMLKEDIDLLEKQLKDMKSRAKDLD